ncbi:hypothetical protein ACFL5O_07195 [Myxococcota bacterium]
MTKNSRITLFLFGIGLSLGGCDRARASAEPERTRTTAAPVTAAPTASTEQRASAKVVRVVFVGKEHPCDCTKKRLELGWAALEQALGTPPKVPVERLKLDTQPEQVEPYRKRKPLMTLPAVYFVDAENAIVALLQGEITAEQVSAVLVP